MKKTLRPKLFRLSAIVVTCAAVSAPLPLVAQSALEEIIITGRKREESLQEVPISISVLDGQLIEDAGIITQRDLFDLIPGIQYDQALDRNSALPSVRGVQSNEVATNRTKVTAFIDGMPILGSQGSIGFGNAQQVEVYRGPQSAAFGRSTFGGAINYITKDPGDEFEGEVSIDVSDFGRRMLRGSISGPINDYVGYYINVETEDSDGYDDYVATDGIEYGTRTGDQIGAKLVFTPTDALTAEIAFSHVDTADGPTAQYFISKEARDNCFDGTQTLGMGGGVYGTGTLSCDWSQGVPIAAQNNRVTNLVEAGVTDENILFLAEAQSLPSDETGSFDERDRLAVQIDYAFDSGSSLQFSAFKGEETYVRGNDGSRNADALIDIAEDPMNPGLYQVNTAMGALVGTIMSDPTDIEETYAEVRWASPGEDRLRYVVGASYYDYSFITNIYFGGYGAILQGQDAVDRYDELVGNGGGVNSVGYPTQVFSEQATNTGVFFNASYDFTDRFTATIEGRYQSDDAGGTDTTSGESASVETKAFLPRLSFNYNLTDDVSFYGQIAKGNNPGGVNIGFFNPDNQRLLDGGIPDGLGDTNGDFVTDIAGCTGDATAANPDCNSFYVSYDSGTFAFFEEESLINYEVGTKGTLLDGSFRYSAAIFLMDWEDQAQSVNLDWDNPTLQGPNANDFTTNRTFVNQGDIEMKGLEFEGTYNVNDNFSLRGQFTILDAGYEDFCSVGVQGSGLDTDPARMVTATAENPYDCYDVSGFDVAEQQSFSASLSPTYNMDIGNGLRLSIRGDIRHEGEKWLDEANVAKTDPVNTMNISFGLSADAWNATIYVNNVTDNDTPNSYSANTDYSIATPDIVNVSGTDIDLDQSNYLITPRQPRTIGLRASYNF